MISDDIIRDLLLQSVEGLELEPTMVLADALLETDRPDLGEELALILANRMPFPLAVGTPYAGGPREQRGRPIPNRTTRDRALAIVFRRVHRRFAWSQYDEEERRRGLRELKEIERNWNAENTEVRGIEIARAIAWLEEDGTLADVDDRTLYERTTWLLNGTFGRAAQILAEEVVDAPPSRHNREAQLFRLVLAFDDLLPPNAANRVWDGLTAHAKREATATIRQVLIENGGEIHAPTSRASRSRRPR